MTATGASAAPKRSRATRIAFFIAFFAGILVLWEALKVIGGDPWRVNGEVIWLPPIDLNFASDVNLPHVWTIGTRLFEPITGPASEPLGVYLFGQALYTWREAFIGFALGAFLGIGLATVFVESGLIERAFVPYVVASQTIPIVALAPLIVYLAGHNVGSVVIISTYLSFFPVTIAMLRGLRSPDPRALELMRSYAASRRSVLWKVRFPASLPYLFTALKITATASIVGAIVAEGPGGIRDGLGRALLFFAQQYTVAPEKLWGAILYTAILGILFFLIVRGVEVWVLRNRPQALAG
jgi:NitT/TauT family transport system permease protein